MPIDLEIEQLIPIGEVPRLIPSSRLGKKLNVVTVYRWVLHGSRGRRLDSVLIGGSRYTSREAVARFAQDLSDSDIPTLPAPSVRSPAQRQRDQAKAAAILDRAGIA
jgi:hypothetical protein